MLQIFRQNTTMKNILLFAVLFLIGLSLAMDMQTVKQRKQQFVQKRLQEFEQAQPKVHYSTATGTAHLVIETPKSLSKRSTYGSVVEGLEAFLAAHPEIGVKDYKTELLEVTRRNDAQIKTLTMIMYQQVYKGINVADSILKVFFNERNQVVSTSGTIISDLNLDVVPQLSVAEAIAFGRPALPTDLTFTLAETDLVVYRTLMTSGEFGTNHLAYHVTFKCTQHFESHYVFVDAHSGTVLDEYSPVYHALNRTAIIFGTGTVYTEGSSLPTDVQAKLAIEINGVQYNAMMNVGGYDGWDLNGGEFRNTINVPTNGYAGFICPNAAFYGAPLGALYCPGFANSIDVIAHEFGHGYVRGIVGNGKSLVYRGQSGALNEAYADIMGETMQMLLKVPQDYPVRPNRDCTVAGGNQRWILADNLPKAQQLFPNVNGTKVGLRDMYNPTCYRNPATTADSTIVCNPDYDYGGVHINSGVLNQVYSLFVDGGDFYGTTYTGVGLIKAFHIFIRGLAKHNPTATFVQHVDYNTAACNELANAGTNLADMLTGEPTGQVISNNDCTTLTSLYAAVKMTTPICGTGPVSPPTSPPISPPTSAPISPPVSPPVSLPSITRGPFPPLILNVGQDYVYWQTSDWADRPVSCRFVGYENNVFAGDKVLTQLAQYVYCPMPVISGAGEIQIQISADGTNWLDPYTLTVMDAYSLSAYGPVAGPIGGGTTIQIVGSGFATSTTGCNPTADDDGFDCTACYFGYDANGQPVPATVDSDTTASCVSPDWNYLDTENTTVEIWLSMNYFLAVGPLYYDYKQGVGPVGAVPLTSAPFGFAPQTPTTTVLTPTATPIAGSTPQKTVSAATHTEAIASGLLAVSGLLMVAF